MKTLQIQIGFFYDVSSSVDFDGLAYFIKREFKSAIGIQLDNVQLFNMLPKDAPAEIPRLQLHSPNNKIRAQASFQRFDLFIERFDTEQEVNSEFFDKLFDKISFVHEMLNIKIARIGLVAFLAEPDENPSKSISEKYLNTSELGSSDQLSDVTLMVNRQFELHGKGFNCHLTIMPGVDTIKQQSIFVKQVDVSTLQENVFYKEYSNNQIKDAFMLKMNEYK
ncbi:hypothetical protein [Scandinavium sp.]|uniref:hypothetical protein n=1 Tax=Scandinavium sp. TaxID=2830653 RepID=UPI0028990E42|nr:hypothetical protein [Scandinavium sp.]